MCELEATTLGHRFGRRVLFRALTLKVAGGEVLAVTGANGTGKTTLVKILAGLLKPSKGAVTLRVGGRAVPREQHPLHVGYVAPYVNVYEDFTPVENLEFVARVRGLRRAGARIRQVLESVQLARRADERIHTFSSGMKQRMKIAVAILASPPVLVFDEPTVSMDAQGHALCSTVTADARRRGAIVVIASNDAGDYAGADRVICVPDYVR